MKTSAKVKNHCKICSETVTKKNGLQCQGSCKKWMHYTCLNYTPGRILDIKAGYITMTCPDCTAPENKTNLTSPMRTKLKCGLEECSANRSSIKSPPEFRSCGVSPKRSCDPECSGIIKTCELDCASAKSFKPNEGGFLPNSPKSCDTLDCPNNSHDKEKNQVNKPATFIPLEKSSGATLKCSSNPETPEVIETCELLCASAKSLKPNNLANTPKPCGTHDCVKNNEHDEEIKQLPKSATPHSSKSSRASLNNPSNLESPGVIDTACEPDCAGMKLSALSVEKRATKFPPCAQNCPINKKLHVEESQVNKKLGISRSHGVTSKSSHCLGTINVKKASKSDLSKSRVSLEDSKTAPKAGDYKMTRSDSRLNAASSKASDEVLLCTIQELCSAVGHLSGQIKKLMTKMMENLEKSGIRRRTVSECRSKFGFL